MIVKICRERHKNKKSVGGGEEERTNPDRNYTSACQSRNRVPVEHWAHPKRERNSKNMARSGAATVLP
jgi:hypothetical protein